MGLPVVNNVVRKLFGSRGDLMAAKDFKDGGVDGVRYNH